MDTPMLRFNPPPAWPEAPERWTPAPNWRPPVEWGPVPAGWALWVQAAGLEKIEAKEAKAQAHRDVKSEKAQEKAQAKGAKTQAKVAAKEASTQAKQAAAQYEVDTYGAEVASETFGLKRVRIYANGYVRVGNSEYRELLSIAANVDNVTRKRAVGRAVFGVLTLGVSTYAPSLRGDLYLIMITASGPISLHDQMPTPEHVQAALMLEAVGNSVL